MGFPLEIIEVDADVVVVGGGGAASRAALSAAQAGARVRLVTKVGLKAGGSTVHGASEIMSMGAAGFGDRADSPQVHYEDTMRAGRGFIDPELVRVLAEDAPARIRDLIALGVPLDREAPDRYKLIKSDFGSYARALGVSGKTGKAFVAALTDELLRLGVAVDANVALVDLLRDAQGAVAGVLGYDPARRALVRYSAPSVILGTGGVHGAYRQQVSTAEMTGDGQAICFRHGAELVNLEFHQIGPALIHPYVQLFSGSCFKLHPRLLNRDGEEFLARYVPQGVDLAEVYDEKVFPFTVSNPSRYIEIAIAGEIDAGRGTDRGGVYLSFAHVAPGRVEAGMPNTVGWLRSHGIHPERDRLEMGIAFQCMNGGVRMTDADAQSTIPGLYVIGELAGGVRGPDRPGGNSLAEGQVFGHRSGAAAARRAAEVRPGRPATLDETLATLSGFLGRGKAKADAGAIAASARAVMQRDCLVEKTGERLRAALAHMEAAQDELESGMALTADSLVAGLSVRNMLTASRLLLAAGLNREETRSAHYRPDFPQASADLVCSFVARRSGDGVAFSKLTY